MGEALPRALRVSAKYSYNYSLYILIVMFSADENLTEWPVDLIIKEEHEQKVVEDWCYLVLLDDRYCNTAVDLFSKTGEHTGTAFQLCMLLMMRSDRASFKQGKESWLSKEINTLPVMFLKEYSLVDPMKALLRSAGVFELY